MVGVVCQPDRPKGRNLECAPCPVKAFVGSRPVPVMTPERVNHPESLAALRALRPDLIVVVAYGQILKAELLALPPLGCLNIHGSLLPRYRGAAPIQWAVANGEALSGVTSMYMDAGMDTGDMLLKRELPIDPLDTGGRYHDKLALAGAACLIDTLALLKEGGVVRRPQDHAAATLAPKLTKEDGRMDWTRPAQLLHNRVRGFNPWPGAFCELAALPGLRLKVLASRVEPGEGTPGSIRETSGEGLLIQTSEHSLRLLQVQPEGRKPMSGAEFVRGYGARKGLA